MKSSIAWSPDTVSIGDLKPWNRNPKRISKKRAKALLDYWQEIGQFQTIAIGPEGEVYDGHQRIATLKAAMGEGYQVAVLRSSRSLTEKEREKLVIAAHVGTTGNFDWEQLNTWDEAELEQWGFDQEALDELKADQAALKALLDSEEKLKQEIEDIAPKRYLRVLISIPVDSAIDAKEIIEQFRSIPDCEIDYAGN